MPLIENDMANLGLDADNVRTDCAGNSEVSNVAYWPIATVGTVQRHVRSWVKSGSGWRVSRPPRSNSS